MSVVVYTRKYCLRILIDLHVVNSSQYERMLFNICMYVYLLPSFCRAGWILFTIGIQEFILHAFVPGDEYLESVINGYN